MLTHLQIRDFAIIDLIDLEVRAGLTVLTGETGAGKSIVVDALALLAGGKAGTEVVRGGAERAELSATFDISDCPPALRELLAEQSVEAGDELTIRRIIASDGRSRSYLNGVSVPLSLLREVGGLVVDIHGQHEFQSLTRASAQRELLDDFGKNTELAGNVREAHKIWVALVNRAVELESKARDRESRIELLRHQVTELKALDLKDGEIPTLTEERTRHSNRGRLAEAAQAAVGLLYDSDDGNAHATASRALAGIKTLSSVDPRLAKVVPLLDEATIQIREAARELTRYLETLDIDPARQEEVERRLAAIEELSRKHRVSPPELTARAAQLEAELAELDSADNNLSALKKQQAEALEVYRKLAAQLSAGRQTAARALMKDVTARMQTLGMAGGGFLIDITQPSGEPTANGVDTIEFRVKTNPGPQQPPRPLAKIASGGELSRLSLAVQVACAAKDVRCMVFDEVDSGVGGAVAEIVGRELKALGFSGQAICVTHLPQVASQGHHHLRVAKLTDGKTTRTTISELTMDERAEELARMLGGLEVTSKAREHAREMLHLAANPDQKTRGGKRKA
jgi:DNA repair protein RecN (Recombination protein N)